MLVTVLLIGLDKLLFVEFLQQPQPLHTRFPQFFTFLSPIDVHPPVMSIVISNISQIIQQFPILFFKDANRFDIKVLPLCLS
ncbi:hypothetical protein DVK07_20545 [Halorubrum sp. Atlit-26R]|nr:hypothetical protein DVK07_20545 [Halorubrum sp. Atlit-26R]